MATAYDSERFLLKEGSLSVGTFTNPHLIGTNATAPASFFTGNVVGYFKQGTINVELPKEFVEARSNTPGLLIRKDLIYKSFSITGESFQFDGESLSLLKNVYSQLAYPVTSPSSQTHDLIWLGSDEPVQSARGFFLDTELTNGNRLVICMFAGRILTEDNNIALAGTDYAVQAFKIDAFAHPSFAGVSNERYRHYGLIDVQTA